MSAMPTTHALPQALIDGQKGCCGCHKIGMQSAEEIKALKEKGFKYAASACDSCHTRHTFSVKEANEPQACQTCHMPDGNHEVRTAWGFLAVRLPLPEDPQWKADQVTILQELGVLDPEGNPTARLDVVKTGDVARMTQEAFDAERNKMIEVCGQCHSESFAKGELAKGDDLIREVDHLLAEAIRIIAALYKDGVLERPEGYAYAFPDLLTFH